MCAGRTYKYVDPSFVIYPFGTGMGYHDSGLECNLASHSAAIPEASDSAALGTLVTEEWVEAVMHVVHCQVEHISGPAGDEVVQVYHVPPAGLKVDHPLPFKRLIAFDRVHLPASSAKVSLVFNITSEDLRLTDKAGGQSLYPGTHTISIWMGHGQAQNLTLVVPPFMRANGDSLATNFTVAHSEDH